MVPCGRFRLPSPARLRQFWGEFCSPKTPLKGPTVALYSNMHKIWSFATWKVGRVTGRALPLMPNNRAKQLKHNFHKIRRQLLMQSTVNWGRGKKIASGSQPPVNSPPLHRYIRSSRASDILFIILQRYVLHHT